MTITVETVAEVQSVHQETVEVSYIPTDEGAGWPAMVSLSHARHGWGDLQFISFPADKAEAVAAAILAAAKGEAG